MPTVDAAPPGSKKLRKFVKAYLAAWNDHDPEAMEALVTGYVLWEDPAMPAPARGHEEVKAFMLDSWRAFPDLRFESTGPVCVAEGSPIVTWPWRMTATNSGPIDPPGFAATGKRIAVEGVDLWEFSGDRIARYRAFYDMGEVSRQLGLAPARGSRAEAAAVRLQRLGAKAPKPRLPRRRKG